MRTPWITLKRIASAAMPQSEREDTDGCKALVSQALPRRVPEVSLQLFHRRPCPGVMGLVANGGKVSKSPQCGLSRFLFAHALRPILFSLTFDVITQLFVNILLLAVTAEQGSQAKRNGIQPVREWRLHTSVNRSTPEIAAEIRSQDSASSTR